MVAKSKSVSSGGAGYDYALGKDQAEIIDKNGIVADNGKELQEEFVIYQDKNHRCKNNNINLIVAPHPDDAKKLTQEDWKKLSDDFMKRMKLDKHQYVTVKHIPNKDPDRMHLHIYCNRIDKKGKAYSDNFISKKAQRIGEGIANERGWKVAKDIQIGKDILEKENLKEVRKHIYDIHNNIMINGRPKDFNDYTKMMQSKGVEIKSTLTKQGKIQGFRVKYQGYDLKATQVHRNMSLSRTGLKTVAPKLSKLNKIKPMTNVLDVGLKGVNITTSIAKVVAKEIIKKGIGLSK